MGDGVNQCKGERGEYDIVSDPRDREGEGGRDRVHGGCSECNARRQQSGPAPSTAKMTTGKENRGQLIVQAKLQNQVYIFNLQSTDLNRPRWITSRKWNEHSRILYSYSGQTYEIEFSNSRAGE